MFAHKVLKLRQAACTWGRFSTYAVEDEIPRITVPHKMQRKIEKIKVKKLLSEAKKKRNTPSIENKSLLISCKRQEYNYRVGQHYSGFSPQDLASHGWKHKQSAGDHFTLLSYAQNPAIERDGEVQSFADLHVSERVLGVLSGLNITTPTKIQVEAIPLIGQNKNVVCAAETGSGKTLAYLLPMVDQLQSQRQLMGPPDINHPRSVILVPTRELADQIMRVASHFACPDNFVPYSVCGGRGTKGRLAWPQQKVMDVVIATPGVLRKLVVAGVLKPRELSQVVLDEADTLLDDSFNSEVMHILKKMDVDKAGDSEHGTQVVLVSATLPRSLEDIIGNIVPMESFTMASTASLHHLMPHVPQKFLRVKPSDKAETIVKLAKAAASKKISTMIFCNKGDTCLWLSRTLSETAGVPNILVSSKMVEKERSGRIERFLNGEVDVLVATDIASRGLDTVQVQHVINFDFPPFMSDYIHRAGRVGRVGSKGAGHVTSLVCKPWEVELLWQIETAARKRQELHNVNANIKRKLTAVIQEKFGPEVE